MDTPMATCARVAPGMVAIPSKRRTEKIRRAIRIRFTFVHRCWLSWPASGKEKGRLGARVEGKFVELENGGR